MSNCRFCLEKCLNEQKILSKPACRACFSTSECSQLRNGSNETRTLTSSDSCRYKLVCRHIDHSCLPNGCQQICVDCRYRSIHTTRIPLTAVHKLPRLARPHTTAVPTSGQHGQRRGWRGNPVDFFQSVARGIEAFLDALRVSQRTRAGTQIPDSRASRTAASTAPPKHTPGARSLRMSSEKHPPLQDLTIDNITPNVNRINSQSGNARLTYLMSRLVLHLHDFARETRLSTDEWMTALNFLVACGQISSDVRHEFILLSDVLGLSLLVDNINHPTPPGCTEGSVLGPFHTHDAPVLPNGSNMCSDPEGEPLLALCTVKDRHGNPVEGVKVDIWETDSSGHYDVQHASREEPSERCVMKSDQNGRFWFQGIKPVSYPIPHDGPVGKLLSLLGRHCWRPAHLHFMFEKEGWDHLITALYLRGDPYEASDAVFGVKSSLIVDFEKVDKATAEEYGVKEGIWLLKQDFVLVTKEETEKLRDDNAREELKKLGLRMKLVDHLPVPELD